ncbi:ornithine cyclodeaminase family protein [Poseidonocella sp. HB161398]|uniref:ornithine cyclodeaminase family protein n=1 Tax=Poseidonocella sp. HB161398 TaxID=2320855 RepID=UPI0011087C0A|nr:ornithine cyclodeaminase [Poseidonocella sp. HB161398]
MTPPYLTHDSMKSSISWPDAVEALRRGHRLSRPEQADLLLGPPGAQLLARAAWIAELGYVIKGDSVVAANAARGLPSVQGAAMLYDPQTGALRAIIESRLLTQVKTAADSVLGACCLARPDSRHLVIVGAGAVSRSLARAYAALFPALERITIWARRPAQAEALAGELGGLKPSVASGSDLQAALSTADIVSTATFACEPVLPGAWIRPGTHVDLVGAFTPEMREADDALMARAGIHVDFRDTTVGRIGELMAPMASGVIGSADIRGDLYDLVAAGPRVRDPEAITVFKNGGGAHLDLMIADYIAGVAEARAISCLP